MIKEQFQDDADLTESYGDDNRYGKEIGGGTKVDDGDGSERVDISRDVYNMMFHSRWGGPAFWYAVYVFFLKLALV